MSRRLLIAPLLFAACLCLALIASGHNDPLAVAQSVQALGPKGPMLFLPVCLVGIVMLVPTSAFCAVAGWLYGPMWGFLLVWPCAVLSAAGCFTIGRTLLRHSVSKLSASYPILHALDQALHEDGPRVLFLLRLSPIMPFAPLSYAMGGSPLRLRGYLIATALGCAPGAFLYVYLGATMEQLDGFLQGSASVQDSWGATTLSWVGLAATLAGVWLVGRRAQAILSRHVTSDQGLENKPKTNT